MNRKEKVELLNLLTERDRRKSRTKIYRMYPEEGPLRRELYVPHCKFFAAGANWRERAMVSANRCITPWTPIEMDNATRLPLEVLGEQEFYVRSWDGETRCNKKASGLFLKSIAPAFRVYLDNGATFDCTCKHRVLTNEGWVSFDQIILASNGLHCFEKVLDYQANCDMDSCSYDLQPQLQKGIDQLLFPLQGDVRSQHPSLLLLDVAEHKLVYSHASQAFFPLSTEDAHPLIEALCEQFEDPTLKLSSQHKKNERRELRLFADELSLERVSQPVSFRQSSRVNCEGVWNKCLCETDTSGEIYKKDQNQRLSLRWIDQCQLTPKFFRDTSRKAIFFPCDSPYRLVGGQKIDSIVPLWFQPIIDFSVDDVKCYSLGGVIHHNTGKTEGVGGYEMTMHLTGKYPDWWVGRRFDRPISAWAAGDTSQTVRDIIQTKLLGPPGDYGTGLIPGDLLEGTKNKAGSVPDAVESIQVRHVSGGISNLGLKSYDQKRKSFQGTEKQVIWLDEECDLGIYAECLLRTMTTDGLVMCTFTPLLGLSETVLSFMPGGLIPKDFTKTGKFVINATWDDAPHLTEQQKADLLKSIPAYQRDARAKGIPQLGSGAIYPIAEADITIEPFEIPPSWPRVYALDVGWNRTAALWGAWDQQSDVVYLYSEHYQGLAEPLIHAEAIKARGYWIPGVVDPASQGASQVDGKRLIDMYVDHGLNLSYADNAVETGIQKVWTRLSTGRLKVFSSLLNFLAEYRIYRRDEKGKIVKENDHLQDCVKYLIASGLNIAMTAPPAEYEIWDAQEGGYCQTDTVDSTTGY